LQLEVQRNPEKYEIRIFVLTLRIKMMAQGEGLKAKGL
jgi:hypothetical protein